MIFLISSACIKRNFSAAKKKKSDPGDCATGRFHCAGTVATLWTDSDEIISVASMRVSPRSGCAHIHFSGHVCLKMHARCLRFASVIKYASIYSCFLCRVLSLRI